MAAKAATAHAGRASLWFWGLAFSLLMVAAAPVAALLGILLAPSIATRALDRSPKHELSHAVLLFGGVGVARPLVRLLSSGMEWAPAIGLASDAGILAIAWSSQILGGLLMEIVPLIARIILERRLKLHVAQLTATRATLETEWGTPPRVTAPD